MDTGMVSMAVNQAQHDHNTPHILEDAIKPTPIPSLKQASSSSTLDKSESLTGQVPFSEPEPFNITFEPPAKRQSRTVRRIRHILLNVYRRIFGVVLVANVVAFCVLVVKHHSDPGGLLPDVATAAVVNFFVAIMVRQDYIVNAMHITLQSVPLSAPLRMRRMLAKIYEYGGMHSGCAVSGTLWFILLTVLVSIGFATGTMQSPAVLAFTYSLLVLFLCIIVFAYPMLRSRMHNVFEYTHRFAGWTSIALFWVDVVLFANESRQQAAAPARELGEYLIRLPAFWFLFIISAHILLPWLRLRKVKFTAERLSEHAIRLHFTERVHPFSSLAIAETPLAEWHPFACFPSGDGVSNSLVISHAGDWTRRTIDSPQPYYYTKGLPRASMLGMAHLFRRVLVVTTGSGIGPMLSYLSDTTRRGQCRVLWSAPDPLRTFGPDICDAVNAADAAALVWDTSLRGRPDMVSLTLQLYMDFHAEAVFVISNPELTRKVVYGCESRGVPAFGPIWDS